jgi:hypothetical protein
VTISSTPSKITIAFRPRDGRFEVADAAIRNDPEFLPNVTELWNGTRPKPQIRRDLMNALRDNAIVNAYAFYTRGRKAGVPKNKLDAMIARWVFGTLLTARYSGSSETILSRTWRASPAWEGTTRTASCTRSTTRCGQLPPLLFAADAWQDARRRLGDTPDVKQRLQSDVNLTR